MHLCTPDTQIHRKVGKLTHKLTDGQTDRQMESLKENLDSINLTAFLVRGITGHDSLPVRLFILPTVLHYMSVP